MPEAAATREPGPPPIDSTWLILQRLDDIRREIDRIHTEIGDIRRELGDVRKEIADVRKDINAVNARVDRLAMWAFGGFLTLAASIIGLALQLR